MMFMVLWVLIWCVIDGCGSCFLHSGSVDEFLQLAREEIAQR